MRITKVPTGEYYLEKSQQVKGTPFEFFTRARDKLGGYVGVGSNHISIPRELTGKRLRFKVEVV